MNSQTSIRIIPIGCVDSSVLEYLVDILSKRFNTEAEIRSSIPVELFEVDKLRKQYLSTSMLRMLSSMPSLPEEVSLGVADVDLYVPSLNFVFGEAGPSRRVAVISITRLRQSFYGSPDDVDLFLNRLGKEAVHEVGHIFRLGHCSQPRCVMYFSNSLADTDRKDDDFCNKCRTQLSIVSK